MNIPLHAQQLQFVIDVASWRNSFLDPLFRFLSYADSPYFAFVLLPLVWIGFSYRWGLRLFYLLLINALINTFFKELVGWPRPSTVLPEVGMLHPPSFGFPSGGAQMGMLLGGLLIYSWRTRLAWVLGVFYILLLSFSRIYLGVHYPIDILGGWGIGLALLFLYIYWGPPIEKFLRSKSLVYCLMLSLGFPLLLIVLTSSSHYHRLDAIAVGVGAFVSLNYGLYLPPPKKIWKGLLRGAAAIAGLFLIFAMLPNNWPISISFAILALWVSLGASWSLRYVPGLLD